MRHPGAILIEKRTLIVERMRSTDPQQCESLTARISLLSEEYAASMREKEIEHGC